MEEFVKNLGDHEPGSLKSAIIAAELATLTRVHMKLV
jgi:hypothetical protein